MAEQLLNAIKIGNAIAVTTVDTDTKIVNRKRVKFKPTLYTLTRKHAETGIYPDTPYRSIHGEPLLAKTYESMSEANDFKNGYTKDSHGKRVKQSGSLPIIYGMEKYQVDYAAQYHKSTSYDKNLVRIFWLDIENKMTDSDGNKIMKIDPVAAAGELTVVTIYDSITNKYMVFGNQIEWTNPDNVDIEYESIYCEDEKDLCLKIINYWTHNYPDIVTGWNSERYDIPYLINRFYQIVGVTATEQLSPWGTIRDKEVTDDFGNQNKVYTIVGISHLDYLKVYKNNTFSGRESYRLDFIATYETGRGKMDFSHLAKNLDELWYNHPQSYISYNVVDVLVLLDIEAKNGFMNIMIDIAYYANINFDDTFSGLRIWDALIHGYLKDQDIITSPSKSATKEDFPGGYVKPAVIGLHKNVMSYDLTSLYPSIIRTLNLGPETIRDLLAIEPRDMVNEHVNLSMDLSSLKELNYTMAANGVVFDNTKKSFISELIEVLFSKRKADKDRMLKAEVFIEALKKQGKSTTTADIHRALYKNKQMTAKVLLNSLFGLIGNVYFRYYRLEMATAITLTGQSIIKYSEKVMNEYLNNILKTDDDYIVLIDTDSIVVSFDKLVDKVFPEYNVEKVTNFLDKLGREQIEPYLEQKYAEYADYVNTTNNCIRMDRENIASSMLIRAKKNYAMKVQDAEGVRYPFDDPYYKIMGLEVIKASTAKVIRGDLLIGLKMILSDANVKDIRKFSDNTRTKFINTPPSDIAKPTSCNHIDKYRGDPIYCKGAYFVSKAVLIAMHNYDIIIQAGDKVKYVPLVMPNPTGEKIIAFIDEFYDDLLPYVNYTEMYNKSFMSPMKSLCTAAGMDLEHSNTLF